MQHFEPIRPAEDTDPLWFIPAAFVLNPGLWIMVALVATRWLWS